MDDDLYGDLRVQAQPISVYSVVQQQLDEAQSTERALRLEVDAVKTQLKVALETSAVLGTNISRLYATATLEISRKDQEIVRLRRLLEEERQKSLELAESMNKASDSPCPAPATAAAAAAVAVPGKLDVARVVPHDENPRTDRHWQRVTDVGHDRGGRESRDSGRETRTETARRRSVSRDRDFHRPNPSRCDDGSRGGVVHDRARLASASHGPGYGTDAHRTRDQDRERERERERERDRDWDRERFRNTVPSERSTDDRGRGREKGQVRDQARDWETRR